MSNETILTIQGNLTRDPELRTTKTGKSVANLSIASTSRRYNKQTNQWEEGNTIFMNCSAWGDLAEHIQSTLTKGTRVIAIGELEQRSYNAQDGTERTVMEMRLNDIAPSLLHATAMVNRIQRQAAAPSDPFTPPTINQNPPYAQPPMQQPMQPAQAAPQAAPGQDPWTQAPTGNNALGF